VAEAGIQGKAPSGLAGTGVPAGKIPTLRLRDGAIAQKFIDVALLLNAPFL
jgi:hypothetical protein